MDPDDERSKLIFTFLDVVEKVQPKAFVMENVKALGVLEKWEPIRRKYLDRATKMGYQCMPFILNATEYGVSQKRERVFFIAIREGLDPFFERHMLDMIEQQKNKAPIIRDLLQPLGRAGTEKNPDTCTAKITFAAHPIMRKSPYAGMYFNGQGRPINIDGYSNTLPASMGGIKHRLLMKSIFMEMLSQIGLRITIRGYLRVLLCQNLRMHHAALEELLSRKLLKFRHFQMIIFFVERRGKFIHKLGMLFHANWQRL